MTDKTIGIAFGGGGARGLSHIHIIKTLDDMGVKPKVISGTSIGAIMGSAMASGMTGDEIEDYMLDAISKPVNLASRLWNARRTGWKTFSEGISLGQFNIERILAAFLPEKIPHDFADLRVPTKLIATDYYGHHEVVMSQGDLRNAIAASAAIPALFKSVKRDERYLIDGGIYNNLPYNHIQYMVDITIAIDVVGVPQGDPTEPPGTIDAAYGATQLTMQSTINLMLKQSPPDVLLRPDIHSYRALDFLKAKEILEDSKDIADELKRKLEPLL